MKELKTKLFEFVAKYEIENCSISIKRHQLIMTFENTIKQVTLEFLNEYLAENHIGKNYHLISASKLLLIFSFPEELKKH
jgi:hypothetical protein